MAYGLTSDNSHSCPADVLVARWKKGLPAAFDITVTSPRTPAILDESCLTAEVAAAAAVSRKHVANDPKCFELCFIGCRNLWELGDGGPRDISPPSLSTCSKPQCV